MTATELADVAAEVRRVWSVHPDTARVLIAELVRLQAATCGACYWWGEVEPGTGKRRCGSHGGWWGEVEGCTRWRKKD